MAFQSRLYLFYALLNPGKLSEVPALVSHFFDDQDKLNSKMRQTYDGLDLSSSLETLQSTARKWDLEQRDQTK